MEFEIFTELPPPALLFSSSTAIVRKIRVAVVVKEAGHSWGLSGCRAACVCFVDDI